MTNNFSPLRQMKVSCEEATSPLTGQTLSVGILTNLATLGIEKLALENEIATLEAAVAEKQEQLRVLSEETLPMAMLEIGLSEFRLNDPSRTRLKLEKYYNGGLYSDDPKSKVFDVDKRVSGLLWLKKNGHGSLIKTGIRADLGKGQEDLVKKVVAALNKTKVPFEQKDDVHHMTFKSFIREVYEANETLPTDIFRVHVGNRVTIGK